MNGIGGAWVGGFRAVWAYGVMEPRDTLSEARCTCREAIRFPDERSEELSRSESRKRVRRGSQGR
jgi:hypothetical protein